MLILKQVCCGNILFKKLFEMVVTPLNKGMPLLLVSLVIFFYLPMISFGFLISGFICLFVFCSPYTSNLYMKGIEGRKIK